MISRFARAATATATLLAVGFLGSAPARAADYGTFIDIETEEDLLDLKTSGEIDDAAFETLKELLADGVDLNTADREELYTLPNLTYAEVDAILTYRKEAGSILDPAVLVKAGALSAKKLGAMAPFILLKPKDVKLFTTTGRFRYGITYVGGDKTVPSMFLSARIKTLKNLDLGLTIVLTRDWLGRPVYDPNRMSLAADPSKIGVHFPKFHVQYKTHEWEVIAGTYRIGFGQRLVFDNTGQYVPNGIRIDDSLYYNQTLSRTCRESAGELPDSPCTGEDRYKYHSPDYRWTDRLRGAAFGIKKIKTTKDHWIQAYGFFSYQTHNIYQYELYNRARCDDPTNDNLPECAAPNVYRIRANRLDPTSRFSFYTLPEMYNEMLGGGNVTYFINRRTYFGVTGYGSDIRWLVDGMDLDFQEWSAKPYGGPFGAIGVNAAYGKNWADLALELAHTFDSMPEKGGFGAILRSVFTFKKQEVELVARYYDKKFANPHGRPISAADEFDGLRHRDELGLRAKYSGKLKDLQLRTLLDVWSAPSEWAAKLRVRTRVDYELATWFRPGFWVEYQDRDLAHSGRGNCYAVTSEEDIEGEPIACQGEKVDLGLQLRFQAHRKLSLTLFYQHRLVDDGTSRFANSFRQDVSAWFLAMYKPFKDLRIRARIRYKYEDILHRDYLEQSLWAYLEASWWYRRTFRIKGRIELMTYLDTRSSSNLRTPPPIVLNDDGTRRPTPEFWARLELEYRF